MNKIFSPFQQIESVYTKKHEGTGLGLSLVRKLVELHGGSIWVESEFGKGSVFTFCYTGEAGSRVAAGCKGKIKRQGAKAWEKDSGT